MRNIRLTLHYNGTDFSGWQAQPSAAVRTIAGELGRALYNVTGETPRLIAAGRTDRGTHSLGQTVNFALVAPISVYDLRGALNAALPHDIAVVGVAEVPLDFHARFSARRRRYRYLVENQPARGAMMSGRAWHVRQPLDIHAMREAAKRLVGRRDLRAFGVDPAGRNTVRHLQELQVQELQRTSGALVTFEFCADAFLNGMVRRIVGFLVEVGLHKREPDEAERLKTGAVWTGRMAPAAGLYQLAVEY